MNTDEKLDYIICMLELNKGRQGVTVTAHDVPMQQAVEDTLHTLKPGRYGATAIAAAAGFPEDKVTAHSIGRILDAMNIPRYRTGAGRGFVIGTAANDNLPQKVRTAITSSMDAWQVRMTTAEVARAAGLEENHSTLIAVGRCLSSMGFNRGGNGVARYYFMDKRKVS